MKNLLLILFFCATISCLGSNESPAKGFVDHFRYFEHEGQLYYGESDSVEIATLVVNADLQTFRSMNYGYAKDKYRAYYCGREVKGASPNLEVLKGAYAHDDGLIFYGTKLIKTDKVKKFDVFSNEIGWSFCGDEKNVYYEGEKTNYDVKTFQLLGDKYVADKRGVYYGEDTKKIKGAKLEDIAIFGAYLVSNKQVFFQGEKAFYDAASFEYLDCYKYTNKETVRPNDYLVKDKNGVYLNNDNLNLDAMTFDFIGKRLFKDKSGVYFISFENNDLHKLELNPQHTQSKPLDIERYYPYPPDTCYVFGDNNSTYFFANKSDTVPHKMNFSIDWNTFRVYMKHSQFKLYEDKNNFYHLAGNLYYSKNKNFRKTPIGKNNPKIIYINNSSAVMRTDTAAYSIKTNILIHPKRLPEEDHLFSSFMDLAPVYNPQNLVSFEPNEYWTDILGKQKSGLTDGEYIYGYIMSIDQGKKISKDLYNKLTPYIIPPEEWEKRRLETLAQ